MSNTMQDSSLDANPDMLRKEISMLKRELKRVADIGSEKDREIEKLKKENYTLINRYRNK
jgi:predicted RNase H-like nuclease (RuvC/YqgF family)